MKDGQIPAPGDDLEHVAEDVRSFAFGRQQVARPGIVAARAERIADDARELAADQDSHVWVTGSSACSDGLLTSRNLTRSSTSCSSRFDSFSAVWVRSRKYRFCASRISRTSSMKELLIFDPHNHLYVGQTGRTPRSARLSHI